MNITLVAVGGAIGAVARYALSELAHRILGEDSRALHATGFPVGTLAVNVLGCLAIGVLATATTARTGLDPATKLLLITGALGSFTTFSALGDDTVRLISAGRLTTATIYAVVTFAAGLGAVFIGSRLAGAIHPTP